MPIREHAEAESHHQKEETMKRSAHSNHANGTSRAAEIARLNDELRTTGEGGQILVTRRVKALAAFNIEEN